MSLIVFLSAILDYFVSDAEFRRTPRRGNVAIAVPRDGWRSPGRGASSRPTRPRANCAGRARGRYSEHARPLPVRKRSRRASKAASFTGLSSASPDVSNLNVLNLISLALPGLRMAPVPAVQMCDSLLPPADVRTLRALPPKSPQLRPLPAYHPSAARAIARGRCSLTIKHHSPPNFTARVRPHQHRARDQKFIAQPATHRAQSAPPLHPTKSSSATGSTPPATHATSTLYFPISLFPPFPMSSLHQKFIRTPSPLNARYLRSSFLHFPISPFPHFSPRTPNLQLLPPAS